MRSFITFLLVVVASSVFTLQSQAVYTDPKAVNTVQDQAGAVVVNQKQTVDSTNGAYCPQCLIRAQHALGQNLIQQGVRARELSELNTHSKTLSKPGESTK